MRDKKTHPQVEFHASAGENWQVFRELRDAVTWATVQSMSGGRIAVVDVVVWSRAGATWWLGDLGAEMYDEDPEASVFQRIEIRAKEIGRIP